MITVQCPQCSSKIRAPDEAAGRTSRCPKCQQILSIPGPTAIEEQQYDIGHSLPYGQGVAEPWYYGFAVFMAHFVLWPSVLAFGLGTITVCAIALADTGNSSFATIPFLAGLLLITLFNMLWSAIILILVDMGRNIRRQTK